MRTFWFEIFECMRKILLILVPIFFEQDSPEQLTIGLIICFMTFGAYMVRRKWLGPPFLPCPPIVAASHAFLVHASH